ncbi:MAG: tetratricopeptide repeat protein [Alphaproteobacteria bacterium]|nr:MAG: tetratricopeptide repeat protein [Alphaproteobacteria bacterium]
MQHDVNGLAVALPDAARAADWNEVQRGFLAHAASTAAALERVLAAAPDFALGHAARGLFLLLLARRELLPEAWACLRRARAGVADARAGHHIRALRAALGGRLRAAADILDDALAIWPTDALAMKLVQALRFMAGDRAGMRASLESIAPQWQDHPLRGYLMGCMAFALEEAGDWRRAEALGREGLALAPDDAWGLHAVAHVMDMTGRPGDGIAWLGAQPERWAHCNNFGYHVWWHLALFHLDSGARDAALALYDRRVRPEPTDDFRDIANAASLLMRFEIEGVPTGRRWEELADLAARRIDDGMLVFADLHYLLALLRAGRAAEADALVARIARDAASPGGHEQHEVAALAGLPLARGLKLFRDGAFGAALRQLRAGLARQQALGGSHAQRDLFWRLTVEAALRAGDVTAAAALLAERGLARGSADPYTRRCMARIAARRRALAGVAAA